jgi:hypothetical protein
VDQLKLNEFKALYKAWRTSIPWVDHLLLGLLVWLEEMLISTRVDNVIDQAIEEYEKVEEPLPDCVTPVYTETSSEASTRLPEMRLTAPWYIDTKE